jgi:hypothetical protein
MTLLIKIIIPYNDLLFRFALIDFINDTMQ